MEKIWTINKTRIKIGVILKSYYQIIFCNKRRVQKKVPTFFGMFSERKKSVFPID